MTSSIASTVSVAEPLVTEPAVTEPVVIAHRGASAYLPEHSMAAYLLAYGQGADFLEPDLVMTADGHLIALHDLTLNATTNVATVFPDRARDDGGFYAIDFALQEIQQLRLNERAEPDTGLARYPQRWPVDGDGNDLALFEVVEFTQLLQMVTELNRSTGRRVGVYPELKFARFHQSHGKDFAQALTDTLERHALPSDQLPVFIQSFEPEPLLAIHERFGERFPLIQLIGLDDWGMNHVDYAHMTSADGLAEVAEYAIGIGPPLQLLVADPQALISEAPVEASDLLQQARAVGLHVHPFTFRREGLPEGLSLERLLDVFFHDLKVEGVFTDNPDVAVARRQQ